MCRAAATRLRASTRDETILLTRYCVVASCESGQSVDIPQENSSVQTGTGHLLSVLSIGQCLYIVLMSSQR